ncbi:MAG: polysaccharide deacetylase family protein [Deltaproteobacteria bacterium]|nr:polysaccharide deacetylase family protein [Deltaproteobacteria bacterium]
MLCSLSVDDLSSDVDWDQVDESLSYARRANAVALVHAHVPGETISIQAIEGMLLLAEQHHLDFVGHDELDRDHEPRAGLALAFDDQATDKWYELRELFLVHEAKVTFYLTRFHNYTDEMKAQMAQLAADGHAIEAHSVDHLNADAYVRAHGLDAYLTDEIVPSFEILKTAGYAPTAFAFPFGVASESTYNAVLAQPGVERIRLSPGSCPY